MWGGKTIKIVEKHGIPQSIHFLQALDTESDCTFTFPPILLQKSCFQS